MARVIIALFIPALFLNLLHPAIGRPFITYAALGDSYPAGNGAGTIKNIGCGVFSEAYPGKVARKLTLAVRNLACGGAFMNTVLKTQVPWVGDSDIVTVQVGGNEADFFSLLNECVYQWKPRSTCGEEVVKAEKIIQSSSYINRYSTLISETKNKLKPDAILLVLGYAHFFNDKTEQCNHATFSRTDPYNLLTREKRKVFNEIVQMLNTVVKGAADAHGAVYVDIDKVFEGHRFCEEGVIEPGPDKSWFFSDQRFSILSPSEVGHGQTVLANSEGGFLDLTRTFHPTVEGHTAIADEIVRVLSGLKHSIDTVY